MASEFPAAEPHGPIQTLFPDVYWVRGRFTANPLVHFTRNMVVLRDGPDLTLVNSVRLTAEGETALAALGDVKHVVKLGAFHGRDDPYYVRHHGAKLWALPRARHALGVETQEVLEDGGALPVPDTQVFAFRRARYPEGAVLLRRYGGLLLTCDSLQHWASFEGCSAAARAASYAMGFAKPVAIGRLWYRSIRPKRGSLADDFDRLLDLPFAHLLSGHGDPLLDCAHWDAEEAITRRFGRRH